MAGVLRVLSAVVLGVLCFFLGIGAIGATLSGSSGGAAAAWTACVVAGAAVRALSGTKEQERPGGRWWPVAAVVVCGIAAQQLYLRWPAPSEADLAEKAAIEAKRAEVAARQDAAQLQINLKLVGERAVKASLKDADSALFRNQFNGGGKVPCGEVNAKNSFGAMGGFRRYVVATEAMVAIEGDNLSAKEFDKLWAKLCKR